MRRREKILALAILCWAVVAASARAQGSTNANTSNPARDPSVLADDGSAETVLYGLNDTSTYQRGCFPPCQCPLLEEQSTRGTFQLTPAGSDGAFDFYEVTDVDWVVRLGDPELRVTGSGTYQVGGRLSGQQRLTLELSLNDGEPIRFDSGLVPGGDEFPDIRVEISLHGRFCYDTVIAVDASPAQVTP